MHGLAGTVVVGLLAPTAEAYLPACVGNHHPPSPCTCWPLSLPCPVCCAWPLPPSCAPQPRACFTGPASRTETTRRLTTSGSTAQRPSACSTCSTWRLCGTQTQTRTASSAGATRRRWWHSGGLTQLTFTAHAHNAPHRQLQRVLQSVSMASCLVHAREGRTPLLACVAFAQGRVVCEHPRSPFRLCLLSSSSCPPACLCLLTCSPCRGTSSMQNTMTDLKAWRVAHLPKRYRRGRLVGVHAGFYKAWVHNDFNRKVLSKLDGISKAATAPLRVWVTGVCVAAAGMCGTWQGKGAIRQSCAQATHRLEGGGGGGMTIQPRSTRRGELGACWRLVCAVRQPAHLASHPPVQGIPWAGRLRCWPAWTSTSSTPTARSRPTPLAALGWVLNAAAVES